MSRRRGDVQHLQVVLDVLCPKGHRVGVVVKFIEPHPRAGTYHAGGMTFQDLPDPTADSGKVAGICSSCQADVQIAWRRAKQALDDHERTARHTGELHG